MALRSRLYSIAMDPINNENIANGGMDAMLEEALGNDGSFGINMDDLFNLDENEIADMIDGLDRKATPSGKENNTDETAAQESTPKNNAAIISSNASVAASTQNNKRSAEKPHSGARPKKKQRTGRRYGVDPPLPPEQQQISKGGDQDLQWKATYQKLVQFRNKNGVSILETVFVKLRSKCKAQIHCFTKFSMPKYRLVTNFIIGCVVCAHIKSISTIKSIRLSMTNALHYSTPLTLCGSVLPNEMNSVLLSYK